MSQNRAVTAPAPDSPSVPTAAALAGPALRDFTPLSAAEAIIVRAAAAGAIAKVSYRRPRSASPDVFVRAELLRFLALGGDARDPVRGHRLELIGASIVGRLDLGAASVPMSLWFYRCSFDHAPRFDRARVHGSLTFADCTLPGLDAEGCRIDGDLSLHAGCTVTGELRLARAVIEGDLDASRLALRSGEAPSGTLRRVFSAEGIEIAGDLKLLGGADIAGETCLVGARIGGALRASGARLTADIDEAGARGVALDLDRARVGADVLLDAGFSTVGQVRLRRARIGGDLDGSDAHFDAVGDASWGEDGGALLLDRARVGGTLTLRHLQAPLQGASLQDARVGALRDDGGTWGQHHVLDGFRYRRFAADAPVDAAMRLEWLVRQQPSHVDGDFRAAPWRQLIRTLHATGHGASADAVAIGREQHLRRAGRIGLGLPAAWRWPARWVHAGWGAFAGYGLRPARLLAAAALAWALCGAVYWGGAEAGGFAPVDAFVAIDGRLAACPPVCDALPAGVPLFRPWLYSLDVLLPVADLRQTRHWAPTRGVVTPDLESAVGLPLLEALVALEALCGWLASAALAVVCITALGARARRA